MKSKKKVKKPLTEEQRLARNKKARERHWKKTGVSDATVRWMKDHDML